MASSSNLTKTLKNEYIWAYKSNETNTNEQVFESKDDGFWKEIGTIIRIIIFKNYILIYIYIYISSIYTAISKIYLSFESRFLIFKSNKIVRNEIILNFSWNIESYL